MHNKHKRQYNSKYPEYQTVETDVRNKKNEVIAIPYQKRLSV